jgi:hypothetical protein
MPRIGTVIRGVYHRPGPDALPAHLAAHYGIRVICTTRLGAGVFRIDHDGGPPWVARMFLSSRPRRRTEDDAGVLRFLERAGFPAERCAHPEPVTMLDGVLWIRPLWLAAWQCWLACVSPKVSRVFVPDRDYIAALAAAARAQNGRGA